MTASAETLTVRLPAAAMERLRRVSQISRRPIDTLVADTLEASLPPLLETVPDEYRSDLAVLESLSSIELREQIFAQLDEKTVERYDFLLERNSSGTLRPAQEQELDALRRSADLLTYRKVYAALILKWRGEYIPSSAELQSTH
ncbi:MAG: hypothetical protein KJZ86_11575 [Caldilineaceae bacterium]|nr:hypothetical protein [Caldilineaceae bacterium]HRJ44628.1 hypothetical protein [Caldilineaceae bacterium]